jgi:hypothetical protein
MKKCLVECQGKESEISALFEIYVRLLRCSHSNFVLTSDVPIDQLKQYSPG